MESLSLCCDINLPSLKKLSLVGVVIDDQMIQNLVAGSPVIEDISIGSFWVENYTLLRSS